MIGGDGQKIILEMNEHDACRLLALIKKEMHRADGVSQTYWQRQTQNILQSIDQASFTAFKRSLSIEDMFRE